MSNDSDSGLSKLFKKFKKKSKEELRKEYKERLIELAKMKGKSRANE